MKFSKWYIVGGFIMIILVTLTHLLSLRLGFVIAIAYLVGYYMGQLTK